MLAPANELGLFASLRKLLGTVIEIAQVRLDLLGTELELEKRRLLSAVFWGAVALLLLGVGTTLLCGFVILLLWDGYRLAAVGVLAMLFVTSGVALIYSTRQRMRNSVSLFGSSVAELERDRAEVQSSDPHEPR